MKLEDSLYLLMNKKAPTGIGAFFVHFNILNTFCIIILSYIFCKINVIIIIVLLFISSLIGGEK